MKHLREHNIGYFQHMLLALYLAKETFLICVVSLIHAVLPFMFEKYATERLPRVMEGYKELFEVLRNK